MTTNQKNIATASIVLFALLLISVGAQQPKPERTPVILSPEASQQWTVNSLQIQNLQQAQQIILLKSHVPDDYQFAGRNEQGQLVFVAPQPASPEKK